ncbi:MAG: hypothetical protein NTU88_15730 [Armatimonadetes bacterium]|nr:hypothetical protein [Armatimonadota bacterium]
MTKHDKPHKHRRTKPSLRAHGHRDRRVGRSRRARSGDSGFGRALARLTDIGHLRGY